MTDGRVNSEWLTSSIPSMQQLGDARLQVHRCRPLIRGGCCQFVAMSFGISKGMLIPLMVLSFCLYLIAAATAGSVLNRNLDANAGFGGTNAPIGNVVTPVFIIVTLIACMVGLASVLAGSHHIRVWRTESLAGAAATAVIAWSLTLLAMGIASKEIHTGYGRSRRLKVVEAFMIILSLTELLYLLALHAGTVTHEGYANAPGHRAVVDPKFGTPAATAV